VKSRTVDTGRGGKGGEKKLIPRRGQKKKKPGKENINSLVEKKKKSGAKK